MQKQLAHPTSFQLHFSFFLTPWICPHLSNSPSSQLVIRSFACHHLSSTQCGADSHSIPYRSKYVSYHSHPHSHNPQRSSSTPLQYCQTRLFPRLVPPPDLPLSLGSNSAGILCLVVLLMSDNLMSAYASALLEKARQQTTYDLSEARCSVVWSYVSSYTTP